MTTPWKFVLPVSFQEIIYSHVAQNLYPSWRFHGGQTKYYSHLSQSLYRENLTGCTHNTYPPLSKFVPPVKASRRVKLYLRLSRCTSLWMSMKKAFLQKVKEFMLGRAEFKFKISRIQQKSRNFNFGFLQIFSSFNCNMKMIVIPVLIYLY